MEIIAEIGQNHNGDMAIAKELIYAAKENGADVAKFQIYDAKALFPKTDNPWFDYNCKTEISRDQLLMLADVCCKAEIEFMASVFDVERIAWLEEVGLKRYKIASRSITDQALIRAIAATNKPILASLGMWTDKNFPEIKASAPVEFLYCVSKYPTDLSELHLAAIDFTESYAGFSDHTIGITASIVAFSRGAKTVEKHFTLDKSMYGPDHSCSMEPNDLKTLADYRTQIETCLQ
nr:N-acetylneuraminate synthase family protein [Desulfobulbaceae bacterium]